MDELVRGGGQHTVFRCEVEGKVGICRSGRSEVLGYRFQRDGKGTQGVEKDTAQRSYLSFEKFH